MSEIVQTQKCTIRHTDIVDTADSWSPTTVLDSISASRPPKSPEVSEQESVNNIHEETQLNFHITQENPEWILEKGKHAQKKTTKARYAREPPMGPRRGTRAAKGSSQIAQ